VKAATLGTFRIGTPRQPGEGLRIGTVRYLPRGVPKRDYAARDYFDVWFPTLAPSGERIGWLRSRPWTPAVQRTFEARYRREMRAPEAAHALGLLNAVAKHTPISIGCYCEDESRCHRSVLHKLIKQAAREK